MCRLVVESTIEPVGKLGVAGLELIEQPELACLGYPRAAAPLVDRRLRLHDSADEPVGKLGGIDRPKEPEENVDLDAMDEHPGRVPSRAPERTPVAATRKARPVRPDMGGRPPRSIRVALT